MRRHAKASPAGSRLQRKTGLGGRLTLAALATLLLSLLVAADGFAAGPPTVSNTTASTVTSSTAVLEADVNAAGSATTYFFEYGLADCSFNPCASVPQPAASVGSSESPVGVLAEAKGLTPGSTYHFRVVASNSSGTTEGPDRTFNTYSAPIADTNCPNQVFRVGSSASLPGCRAYEMVSPEEKNGGDIVTLANINARRTALNQASITGSAMTYSSYKSFGDAVSSNYSNQYIASRGPNGWSNHGISPVHPGGLFQKEAFSSYYDLEIQFKAFSDDLSSTWFVDDSITPLSPLAQQGYVNIYGHDISSDDYLPVISNPSSVTSTSLGITEINVLGHSQDEDHALVQLRAPLTPNAVPGQVPQLYELNREASDAQQTLTVTATGGTYGLTATSAHAMGKLTSGSPTVTNLKITAAGGGFHAGDRISATGIPAGTTVLTVGEDFLTLSQNATANAERALTGSETTGALAATATAGEVQTVLEALPAIGTGNVVVAGGPGSETGSAPYTLNFVGELAGTPIDPLVPANLALTGGSPSSGATVKMDQYGGHLTLVSVLPNGQGNTDTSVGGPQGGSSAGGVTHGGDREERLVSDDGSRIFWTSLDESTSGGTVYVRQNPDQPQSALNGEECTEPAKACTIEVASSSSRPALWTATPTGSKALISTSRKGGTLQLFDVDAKTSTSIAGEVVGVLGTSEDLSYIYFISMEALAPGGVAGKRNIYLDHNGEKTFVARVSAVDTNEANAEGELTVLPPAEEPASGYDIAGTSPSEHASRVAPDGQSIVFESMSKQLAQEAAGYDNANAANGEPNTQVYTYEVGGDVICVSCNPSGSLSVGKELQEPYKVVNQPAGRTNNKAHRRWTAAWIPTAENPLHTPRALSDDGNRVFFNSFDDLALRDTNGVQDVYLWEAPGSGSCEVGSSAYSAQNQGCVSLISSGESPSNSEFVDASPSGDDVFFYTASSLLPQDTGLVDIYDARVDGGFPQPVRTAACEGEACQSAPTPPNDPTPASSAFNGPGNLVQKRAAKKRPKAAKKHSKKKKKQHNKRQHRSRANHSDRRAH